MRRTQTTSSRFLAYLTLCVFCVAAFLRFYQVAERFIFDIDTEYQALLATTIVKDFHIIWIGVSASNIGYYLGPGLVYLTALLLWITKDPMILGYAASTVGVLTMASVWYVSHKLFNEKIALIALVLYGLSSQIIGYDRKFWPIFVPLVGVWMLFGLVRSKENKWWLLLCTFLVGASFHIHLSLLIFIPFVVYAFIRANVFTFTRSNILFVLLNFALYLLLTSPLLVFDFVHNFDNLLTPLRFVQQMGRGGGHGARAFPWKLLALALTSLFAFKFTKQYANRMIYSIIAAICLALLVYPGPVQEYYSVILFPFVCVGAALLISPFKNHFIVGMLLCLVTMNVYSFFREKNPLRLELKKQAIAKVCPTLTKRPYFLAISGDGRDYLGWYYLYTVYCKQPSRSTVDGMFGWLYPEHLIQAPPAETLVQVTAPN